MPRAERPEVIDAHVHVGTWKYQPTEQYIDAMASHGLRRAVLSQFLGNPDNAYVEGWVADHPDRFAGVGLVDPTDPDAPKHVAAIAERGVLRGIRVPATAPRALWRAIADHGLLASVCGPFEAVVGDEFANALAEVPTLHLRLEHLGGVKMGAEPPPYERFRRFLGLAERPDTSTTWSGFFLNATTPYPYPDAEPFLRMTVDAYGAERIMWSGDWNRPDLAPGEYEAAIAHVTDHAPFLDADQQASILGASAARLFWPGTR